MKVFLMKAKKNVLRIKCCLTKNISSNFVARKKPNKQEKCFKKTSSLKRQSVIINNHFLLVSNCLFPVISLAACSLLVLAF